MSRAVWTEESKTGLGFEIGPRQQKLRQHPNVQLIGNPAVVIFAKIEKIANST